LKSIDIQRFRDDLKLLPVVALDDGTAHVAVLVNHYNKQLTDLLDKHAPSKKCFIHYVASIGNVVF
jgi:hypothetical protein